MPVPGAVQRIRPASDSAVVASLAVSTASQGNQAHPLPLRSAAHRFAVKLAGEVRASAKARESSKVRKQLCKELADAYAQWSAAYRAMVKARAQAAKEMADKAATAKRELEQKWATASARGEAMRAEADRFGPTRACCRRTSCSPPRAVPDRFGATCMHESTRY